MGYLNILKGNLKKSTQDLNLGDEFLVSTGQWFEIHSLQRKALLVVQYQKSVAYSSAIARLKPHQTFMGIIRMQDAAA